MKTYVCREFGPPDSLAQIDVPMPEPKAHELLVEVTATGIGFVDGLMIQGLYQVKPPLPYYPGSEFAGVVKTAGADVSGFKTGDRVLGLTNAGALATATCASAAQCFHIPDGMSDPVAAGWFINYLTALYGLQTCGGLEPGETLLILGAAGGVGSAAIAIAKAMGARVIAAASSDAKRAAAAANGADEVLDYSRANWRDELKSLTAETGLNMVYDPVGGSASELALRSLAPDGRLLVVGFASGTIPKIPLNLVLLKRSSIVGVDWGGDSRQNPELNQPLMETLFNWFSQGKLTPANVVTRGFDSAREALAEQLNGAIPGKLVIVHNTASRTQSQALDWQPQQRRPLYQRRYTVPPTKEADRRDEKIQPQRFRALGEVTARRPFGHTGKTTCRSRAHRARICAWSCGAPHRVWWRLRPDWLLR